ncbi:hypothetical protein ACWQXT_25160 [Citrobacter werkmanii]|uniref:hypothetical protein n=1 Tax=Citrobacter TaxID=544 RepID=UPI00136A184B|nr:MULTISPECIES: hypothetical protein [Citrobacter]MYL93780.1 hypothetical protein [Citrobacter werkmanii]
MTTITRFTKEQLIAQAKNNLIGLKNYVTVYPERAESEALNIRLAEIALASLEAEPVAYIIQDKYERERGTDGHLSRSHASKYVSPEDINEHEIICTALFKAPPLAHSVPDEWTFQNTQRYREDTGRQDAWSAMWGWNACRAAMLKADGTLTNEGTMQAEPVTAATVPDGWKMVPVELTCAMDDAAWEAYHETRSMSDIWAALLAAAPNKE